MVVPPRPKFLLGLSVVAHRLDGFALAVVLRGWTCQPHRPSLTGLAKSHRTKDTDTRKRKERPVGRSLPHTPAVAFELHWDA